MTAGENIYFTFIAMVIFLIIGILFFIFRKRLKIPIIFTLICTVGFVSYYLAYPTIKVKTHVERYELLIDYLEEQYPGQQFDVYAEQYEDGMNVGEFMVNKLSTPLMGVTLRVQKDGNVQEIGLWDKSGYPMNENVWKDLSFSYLENYQLGVKEKPLQKVDELFDEELAVFALELDHKPAIAIYKFTVGAYSRYLLEIGDEQQYVEANFEGISYIYVAEAYEENVILLSNGKTLDISNSKGKLITVK